MLFLAKENKSKKMFFLVYQKDQFQVLFHEQYSSADLSLINSNIHLVSYVDVTTRQVCGENTTQVTNSLENNINNVFLWSEHNGYLAVQEKALQMHDTYIESSFPKILLEIEIESEHIKTINYNKNNKNIILNNMSKKTPDIGEINHIVTTQLLSID